MDFARYFMYPRRIMMIVCTVGFHVALARTVGAQDTTPAIVPRPAEMWTSPEWFRITESTEIIIRSLHPEAQYVEAQSVAEYLAEWLREQTGYAIPVRKGARGNPAAGSVVLATIKPRCSPPDEGYTLTIKPNLTSLFAPHPRGLLLGVQTIRQILGHAPGEAAPGSEKPTSVFQLPCVVIRDEPRYRWRGMLLDCGRHFMDKEFVKRYIDLLAYHKMNVLHWHLTEDQGWRIEIKKYPKLTEIGAWREATRESEQPRAGQRYGGFYTQDDIREIVAYAKSRHVTIVPEIEMPGHSVAALAAYPELSCTGGPFEVSTRWGVHQDVYCAGNDQVFEFLEDVLSEVIELFPSEFIHIGGDECPKQRWKACPKCQARIKAEGLKDEHELQSYFIRRIEKFLNSKGRRLVGWDEILEGGLAPNATVQSWRGMRGALAAATAGHDVISSPTSHCYLDYAQVRLPGEPTWMGYLPLERVYSFEPTPAELTPEQARHVLGLEGNMWTEHAPRERVDRQVFPRLCALAEVGWSPKELRDWEDFSARMMTHYRRLDALGVTYYIAPPRCISGDRVFMDSTDVVLDNPLDRGEVRYTLDGKDPTQSSPKYAAPLLFADTTTVRAQTFLPTGHTSDVVEYRFRKLTPLEPVDVTDVEPGLTCEYYEGSWRCLPDFDRLTPTATSTSATFDLGLRKRDDHFAFRFTGFLEAPADGVYTFYLVSDDGSRLWIGTDLLVDHHGLHSASEKRGQVILKAGKHPITVAFFEAGGAQRLEVNYEGPGIAKQPIPASVLWRSSSNR